MDVLIFSIVHINNSLSTFYRSDNAHPKSCSNNNNNPQNYEVRDRGGPGANPFLDDVRDTSDINGNYMARKDGQTNTQTKQSVYDTYQSLCKYV